MKKKKNSLFYKLYGVIFGAVIIGCTVCFVILPKNEYSSREKRVLASFPQLSAASVTDGRFMEGLEDYEADHFPARDGLITLKTEAAALMGKKSSHGIIRLDADHLAECFTEPGAQDTTELIEAVNAFATRHADSKTYFCLVPNAVSTYEDRTGEYCPGDDQNAYIDDIYRGLSSLKAIDVREIFALNKDRVDIYYASDHHWTSDGAYMGFLAAQAVMGLTSQEYSAVVIDNEFLGTLSGSSGYTLSKMDSVKVYLPLSQQNYTVSYDGEGRMAVSCYDTAKLEEDDKYLVFFGGNYPRITIKTDCGEGRKLLLIKDSYANCFVPFLLRSYGQITVIDPRYYSEDLDLQADSVGYDDILFLYNVNTLSKDNCLVSVLNNR